MNRSDECLPARRSSSAPPSRRTAQCPPDAVLALVAHNTPARLYEKRSSHTLDNRRLAHDFRELRAYSVSDACSSLKGYQSTAGGNVPSCQDAMDDSMPQKTAHFMAAEKQLLSLPRSRVFERRFCATRFVPKRKGMSRVLSLCEWLPRNQRSSGLWKGLSAFSGLRRLSKRNALCLPRSLRSGCHYRALPQQQQHQQPAGIWKRLRIPSVHANFLSLKRSGALPSTSELQRDLYRRGNQQLSDSFMCMIATLLRVCTVAFAFGLAIKIYMVNFNSWLLSSSRLLLRLLLCHLIDSCISFTRALRCDARWGRNARQPAYVEQTAGEHASPDLHQSAWEVYPALPRSIQRFEEPSFELTNTKKTFVSSLYHRMQHHRLVLRAIPPQRWNRAYRRSSLLVVAAPYGRPSAVPSSIQQSASALSTLDLFSTLKLFHFSFQNAVTSVHSLLLAAWCFLASMLSLSSLCCCSFRSAFYPPMILSLLVKYSFAATLHCCLSIMYFVFYISTALFLRSQHCSVIIVSWLVPPQRCSRTRAS